MKKITVNNIRFPRFLILVALLILFGGLSGQVAKVELFPYMVVNETNNGDATLMVDEQELSGDPLNGDNYQPATSWSTSYGSSYPLAAYIDLEQEMNLMHIFIFDYNGTGDLIVEYGEPGNWNYLFTEPLNKYKKWKQHDVEITTRYLRIVKTLAGPKFSEILIYADNPESIAPAISDLSANNPQPGSADLTWTDIEGNAATGALTTYDLRYHTSLIDDENFENCLSFNTGMQPLSGGEVRSATIGGLESNSIYYFAIKAIGETGSTTISNIASITTTHFVNEIEEKLFLEPAMVFNESGMGDAGLMVDEQEIAGDPLNNAGGEPVVEWKPSYVLSDYPASAYIDLGATEQISRVFFRDINSVGDVVVEYGNPSEWIYLLTEPCNQYMQWKQHDVNINTRFLRITLTHREAKFSEMVIYRKAPQLVEEKIVLSTEMITNPLGYGDAWKLADEQDIAGDPAGSPGGNPVTYWQTGFQSSIPYPLYAILDLGKPYLVTKLFLRDTYDVSDFHIYTGSEQNWKLAAVDHLTGYLSWNQHEINTETRYLRFGKTSASANVAEVVIYGMDTSPGQTDTIPPATITDLAAVTGENPANEILLTWTAPGDDDAEGICNAYQIRFSTEEINQENFYQATEWPLPPEPSPPGTTESAIIQGLNPATEYYFAVRANDENYNTGDVSPNATCTTGFEIGGEPFRIVLTPEMVLNEYAQGDATLLVDEQQTAGDPMSGSGGTPLTVWEPGTTDWKYPCYALIDLMGMCNISQIYLFNSDGTAPVDVFTGEPFNWDHAFTDSLQNTGQWLHHEINAESRYIRLKINEQNSRISEIVVYASRLEELADFPEPVIHEPATMCELIGINAFVDDPPGKMAVAGFVREYHSWMWCEGNNDPSYPGYPDNENRFNVMGWNFDYYYQNLNNSGITACPAIQRNVPWLTGFDYGKLENKPILPGENPEDPLSYAEHADHLFQYAARYGNVEVDDNLLKLADNQEILTGQNLLRYFENWNEPDKWWRGRDAFFTPYEYAAMASADIDGHRGAMGNTAGIKNADPDVRLVMGGLAKPDLNYIKAIKLWADYHREGDLPFDVVNVHHYCNDGTTQSSGSIGISPEEDNLKDLMKTFVDYRNRFLPGKEVWITEFGYDTHPESVQRAPAIGTFTQEEVQAQWLVRSFLELAAAGVDKAAMYMLRDVDPNSTTKFNTSGLCASKSNQWEPKPSWYYVNTMKNRLSGMTFDQEIASGNPDVRIYKFQRNPGNFVAYAVWCPTSNETTVSGYELNLAAGETQALLIELMEGHAYGQEKTLPIDNQKISIDVSERPVFVLAAEAGYTFPKLENIAKLHIDSSMVVNESGEGDPTRMVDEQELSENPYQGMEGEPVTVWSTGFSAEYPVHAYLDLNEARMIETIYLRDMNATGDMSFSIGEPGNWTEVATENCGRYKTWSNHVIQKETRYLRVTRYEPTANFSEILIYVRE